MTQRSVASNAVSSNRRDFLKAGSAFAVAGALTGDVLAAEGGAGPLPAKPEIPRNLVGCPPGYPQDLTSAEVKRRFLKLLGEFERPSVPLNHTVTEEIELPGGVVRQRIEYGVAPGERVPAYHLFRRSLAADAPGILSIHGHGGDSIFPVGKAYHCHPRADDSSQYSYRAALAGFRVLAPDALLFGERQDLWGYSHNFAGEIVAQAELTGRGRSLAWKSVWDNSRALEMLERLGARRLGVIGLSGGSTQGYILASVNEKVRAAACYASFATLRHQFYQYRLYHCLYHYIPGMVAAGIDWDQVVALAAPRRLFMERGMLDAGTPEPMFRAFVTAIERRCTREHLPLAVTAFEEPQVGHAVTELGLQAGLAFLRKNLI
jgi:dienelactone hydrolase